MWRSVEVEVHRDDDGSNVHDRGPPALLPGYMRATLAFPSERVAGPKEHTVALGYQEMA